MIKEEKDVWSDFPVCPWCEEEVDKDALQDISDVDFLKIDDFELIRCPSCGKAIEVRCSLVYSTCMAEEDDFAEEKLIYDVESDLNGYNNEDEE